MGSSKPPFLNAKEVRDLAKRLNTSTFVVATVLQVAGHVLRERYRRRGWISRERGSGARGRSRVARKTVAIAIETHAPIAHVEGFE